MMSETVSQHDQPRGQPGNPGQFASTDHLESSGTDVITDDDLQDAPIVGTPSEFAMRKRDAALRAKAEADESAQHAGGIAGEAFDVSEVYTTKAADQGVIGRWFSGRKATAAAQRAEAAAEAAQVSQQTAASHAREADRMAAGIEAEREVARAASRARSTKLVVHGVDLGPGVGDVDVVAEGSYGVAFIESKAGGGDLQDIGGGRVQAGSRTIPGEPLTQVRRQANTAAKEGASVTPIVCVPNSDTPAVWSQESGAWLVGSGNVASLLDSLGPNETRLNDVVDAADRHLYGLQVERAEWANNASSKADEFAEWANNAEANFDKAQSKIDEWESNGWARSSNGADAVASKREWQDKLNGQIRRYSHAVYDLQAKARDYGGSAREIGESREANARLGAQATQARG